MIYIVRHGQTDWNVEGIYQGRIDIPLNKTGIEQAKKTKEELKGIKFDKVFSSPLKRAIETAQIICNNPIIKDDRIIERCNGKDILVVTHAGVSIYAKCYFEGEPKDGNYLAYKLKNCKVLKYDNK